MTDQANPETEAEGDEEVLCLHCLLKEAYQYFCEQFPDGQISGESVAQDLGQFLTELAIAGFPDEETRAQFGARIQYYANDAHRQIMGGALAVDPEPIKPTAPSSEGVH
jgi:hypothetical protein